MGCVIKSTQILLSGGHYNPFDKVHGSPRDFIRHVGDLGNVQADEKQTVNINILDHLLTLYGPFSIVGRSLMLHAGKDDLGRGGDDGSLATGNAGGRIGCCVIGLA